MKGSEPPPHSQAGRVHDSSPLGAFRACAAASLPGGAASSQLRPADAARAAAAAAVPEPFFLVQIEVVSCSSGYWAELALPLPEEPETASVAPCRS